MAAIGTFISPAGCRRPEEDAVALIHDIRAGKRNRGPGVVHEEHIPVLIGDRAAVSGKCSRSLIGIAGHGLVNHHRLVIIRVIAVLFIIIGSKLHLIQGDAVLAFHHDALGGGGSKLCVRNRDIRRRIDDGRADAVGGVRTVGHIHGAAAPVRPDRRRRIAGGMNREAGGVHRTAAGGHQSAGAVAGGLNHRILDIHRRSLAVAEYRIGVGAVRGDIHIVEIQGCSVGGKYSRILAVEICLIALRFAGFYNLRILIGSLLAVRKNRMSAVLGILIDAGIVLLARTLRSIHRDLLGSLLRRRSFRGDSRRLCSLPRAGRHTQHHRRHGSASQTPEHRPVHTEYSHIKTSILKTRET